MFKTLLLLGIGAIVGFVVVMAIVGYCVQAWADFIWPYGDKE